MRILETSMDIRLVSEYVVREIDQTTVLAI